MNTDFEKYDDSDDFYVLGLVAENLGFRDIARTYYARVLVQKEEPLATVILARKRLTAMDEGDNQKTNNAVQ